MGDNDLTLIHEEFTGTISQSEHAMLTQLACLEIRFERLMLKVLKLDMERNNGFNASQEETS